MSETTARLCDNCHEPWLLFAPAFLRLPGAAEIVADALDRHQAVHCARTCQHCLGMIPRWIDGKVRRYCSLTCAHAHRSQLRAEQAEELLHLTFCGASVATALTRIGWTFAAAEKWAQRHGRDDVLEVLHVSGAA